MRLREGNHMSLMGLSHAALFHGQAVSWTKSILVLIMIRLSIIILIYQLAD